MRTVLKFGAAACTIALAGAGLVAIQGANAGNNCKSYALSAAKQHKENEQRSCGFKGPDWSKDIKAHQKWCASVPPQMWRDMLKKRQEMLASCK